MTQSKLDWNWKTDGIYVIVSAVLVVTCAVLGYFDYEELQTIKKNVGAEETRKTALVQKKLTSSRKKKDLYRFHKSFDLLKKMLPNDEAVYDFYLTIDTFRKQEKIKAFSNVKQVEDSVVQNDNIEQEEVVDTKKKVVIGPFEEKEYEISFVGSFDQMGKLVNKIERYDRFFSLKKVSYTPVDPKSPILNKSGKVSISVVTFKYKDSAPTTEGSDLNEQIAELFKEYKPSSEEQESIVAYRAQIERKNPFVWKTLEKRNIFDRFLVLSFEGVPDLSFLENKKKNLSSTDPENTPEPKKIEEKELFQELLLEWASLILLVNGNSWGDLEKKLKDNNYIQALNRFQIYFTDKKELDLEGKKREKILLMHEQLLTWQDTIVKRQSESKRKEFIEYARTQVTQMEILNQSLTENKDFSKIVEIRGIYDELSPGFSIFQGKEEEYPEIVVLKQRMEKAKGEYSQTVNKEVRKIFNKIKNVSKVSINPVLKNLKELNYDVFPAVQAYYYDIIPHEVFTELIPRIIIHLEKNRAERVEQALEMLNNASTLQAITYYDVSKCLELPSREVKLAATRLMRNKQIPKSFEKSRFVKYLISKIEGTDFPQEGKEALLQVIAQTQEKSAFQYLEKKIFSKQRTSLDNTFIMSLRYFPGEETISLLQKIIQGQSITQKDSALLCLSQMKDLSCAPFLIRYWQSIELRQDRESSFLKSRILRTLKRVSSVAKINTLDEWRIWWNEQVQKKALISQLISGNTEEEIRALILIRDLAALDNELLNFVISRAVSFDIEIRQVAGTTLVRLYKKDYDEKLGIILYNRAQSSSLTEEMREDVKKLLQNLGATNLSLRFSS